MEIKIGSLTPQAFKGYGQVVELPQDPDKALVATEFIYFWIASEEADWCTGQTLIVDGGYSMI